MSFTEVCSRGAHNIPQDGPIIFLAAPHHNQSLDVLAALEVYRATGKPVRFLVTANSMKRTIVGSIVTLLRSIPVRRRQDEAKSGKGRIYLSAEDPCIVLGNGTHFVSEITPKMSLRIRLPASSESGSEFLFAEAEVMEVRSDTELRVKRAFRVSDHSSATSLLKMKTEADQGAGVGAYIMMGFGGKDEGGVEFKLIPFIDQEDVYHYVYECLRSNGRIVTFPEGYSHDRPDLLPLKAGTCMMALGTMAKYPEVNVKIVPVGLTYFYAHRFRSRAAVEFGQAIDVPGRLVEKFRLGCKEQKRESITTLLDMVYEGLKDVTVRAPDYETLALVRVACRLYNTPGRHFTLGQTAELNRRFLEGYSRHKDLPRVIRFREGIAKYDRLLRDLGLRDHQVPRATTKANRSTLIPLSYHMLLLLIWTTLALPDVILNSPILIFAIFISRGRAQEALAHSSTRTTGRDVLATAKVVPNIGFTPALYGFYALTVSLVAFAHSGEGPKWMSLVFVPAVTLLALSCIADATLRFGDAGTDILKSLRPLMLSLTPGKEDRLNELKSMRSRLANELIELIDDLGCNE